MEFAGLSKARILLCKHYKFGEKFTKIPEILDFSCEVTFWRALKCSRCCHSFAGVSNNDVGVIRIFVSGIFWVLCVRWTPKAHILHLSNRTAAASCDKTSHCTPKAHHTPATRRNLASAVCIGLKDRSFRLHLMLLCSRRITRSGTRRSVRNS